MPRAILLDALGTLVELVDPWGSLAGELAARGAPVAPAEARRALLREMDYYRAHHHVAADLASLEALRDRCAEVLRAALPAPAAELPVGEIRAALLAALRFRAFPEVPAVLDALRGGGARLVVVSNWDVSLHDVLRRAGLACRLDAVLTSAEEGIAKPDPELFARALARAGVVDPADALHVGDDPLTDIAGARAAGVPAVLLARGSQPGAKRGLPAGVRVIGTLSDLLPGSSATI
jgi:putative hydrolase of the HAD superfamily